MALTKVTGQVINSTTDLSVGVATVGGGTSTGDLYVVGVATFSGDISIGGTLTYEDVTNVDSVGLITARKGITVTANGLYVNAGISTFNADVKVGSGITLSPDGDVYTTGITTIATKLGIGSVHLGGTATDALLTIKGDTNDVSTPSIRLLDGADAREVSITNTSGDFVASVHGVDNAAHGHLKVFESGIVQFSNGGASGSNTERLRINVDGKVGINTNAGVAKLTVDAPSGYSIIANGNSNAIALGSNGIILFGNKNAQAYGSGGYDATEHIFKTSGTQRVEIDTSGRVLVGHTATESMFYTGSIQVQGTNSTTSAITVKSNQADSGGPAIVLGKSRSGSVGGNTVVQSADEFGCIYFNGADGTDTTSQGAYIRGSCDGSPGSNDMPGRLTFGTTADGAATSTERMRIDAKGRVLIGCNSSSYAYSQLVVEGNATFDGGTGGIQLQGGFTNPTGQGSGLGEIRFTDANEAEGAVIKAESDAAWSNGSSYPSYLSFKTTAASATSSTERLRIDSAGNIEVKRGGISAIPMFQLYGSGNASDAVADNLRFHNWGDANGDYWQLGSNLGLDANGNNTKPSTTLKGAAVMIDGRGGRLFVKTSPSSTSTVYEGLVVDSLGRVTKPQTPIFRAYGSGGATQYNGTIMGLSLTNINRGSHYDTSTNVGRFTAPVDGVYLFHVGFFPNAADSVRVELRVNGSAVTNPYINGYNTAMGAGTPSVSGGQILNLSASDYVEAAVNGNMTNTYNGHTGFSGVLLG